MHGVAARPVASGLLEGLPAAVVQQQHDGRAPSRIPAPILTPSPQPQPYPTQAKTFLERQLQRFQRTECFWLSLPSHKLTEATVLLLFQVAPDLQELVVYANEPKQGDDFVRLLCDAGTRQRHREVFGNFGRTAVSAVRPLKTPRALHQALKRLTFRRVWLSSKSHHLFVDNKASLADTLEADSDNEASPASAFCARMWARSLEELTLFNIPPSKQRRETSAQVIFSLKPLEQAHPCHSVSRPYGTPVRC